MFRMVAGTEDTKEGQSPLNVQKTGLGGDTEDVALADVRRSLTA